MKLLEVFFVMLIRLLILNLFIIKSLAFCDKQLEFLCRVDNRCIPKTKVCNFIRDCSDGEDEAKCGSCRFDRPPERCGLDFLPDRIFGWFRKQSSDVRDLSYESRSTTGELNGLMYYMRLDLNDSMKHSAYLHHNNQDLIFRPIVLFPQLQPTNNKKCRFSMQMRLNRLSKMPKDESPLALSWPTVNMDVIYEEDKLKRDHKLISLRKQQQSKQNATEPADWVSYEVAIGEKRSIWTVELLVELKMRSYAPYLANFQFLDCESLGTDVFPADQSRLTIEPTTNCSSSDLFKCHLSGLCIDISLVCDYGFDCGNEDASDEQYCDDYPGRCDFEDETRCDWSVNPSKESWLWVSAHDDERAKYGNLPRPPVDHTIQSSASGGHYMLTNLAQKQREFRLSGPVVRLQAGSDDCRFRFWLSGQKEANSSSPLLHVGGQNIATESLFSNNNKSKWKRYERSLLNKSNFETQHLLVEIVLIADANFRGFVALDDLSFTPDCSLTFQLDPVEEVCGENKFFCAIPTRVTNAYCAPIDYYCDFKNDCGLTSDELADESSLASDEFDCPRVCLFKESGLECKFNILDEAYLIETGELGNGGEANEAFSWQASNNGLVVESRASDFIEHYEKQMANRNNASRWRTSKASEQSAQVNLRDFRLELPKFTGCHGNCLFELVYSWSASARNLLASVVLDSENVAAEILLKRLVPEGDEQEQRQTVRFGLGQQRAPFRLIVEVAFEGDLHYMSAQQVVGSFQIHSYRFVACNFVEGLVDTTHQVQFDEFVDDEGAIEFPPAVDKSCEPGFFQCDKPVVCIPESAVCDMQLDCQGGADELDCGSMLTFDFDTDNGQLETGWSSALQPDSLKQVVEWRLIGGAQVNPNWRSELDSGPPFDHTRADDRGGFLLLTGSDHEWPPVGADLISPRFVLNANSSSCRLVLYLYFWGEDLNEFQVLRRSFLPGDLYEDEKLFSISKLLASGGKLNDSWQRVAVEIKSRKNELQFSIVLRALKSFGWSDLIGVDDISLSATCRLSQLHLPTGQRAALEQVGALTSKTFGETLFIGVLLVATCSLVASGLLILASKSRAGSGGLARRAALLIAAAVAKDESVEMERRRSRDNSHDEYSLVSLNDRALLVEADALQQQVAAKQEPTAQIDNTAI